MADKAVPELDPLIGYYIERDGQLSFETYNLQFDTMRFALIDMIKNPLIKELFFNSGGIWLRLTLPNLAGPIKVG
jgi:hypothetical protein